MYNQYPFGNYPYTPMNGVTDMYGSQSTNVIKVNGREGANEFKMRPNCSALLLDQSQPIVWFKQTDGAGYPTVTGYKLTPLENPENELAGIQNAVASLSVRLDKLEKELGVNVESDR